MKCLYQVETKKDFNDCEKTELPCPYSGILSENHHEKLEFVFEIREICFFATEITRQYNDRFLHETRKMIEQNPKIESEISKR